MTLKNKVFKLIRNIDFKTLYLFILLSQSIIIVLIGLITVYLTIIENVPVSFNGVEYTGLIALLLIIGFSIPLTIIISSVITWLSLLPGMYVIKKILK